MSQCKFFSINLTPRSRCEIDVASNWLKRGKAFSFFKAAPLYTLVEEVLVFCKESSLNNSYCGVVCLFAFFAHIVGLLCRMAEATRCVQGSR